MSSITKSPCHFGISFTDGYVVVMFFPSSQTSSPFLNSGIEVLTRFWTISAAMRLLALISSLILSSNLIRSSLWSYWFYAVRYL